MTVGMIWICYSSHTKFSVSYPTYPTNGAMQSCGLTSLVVCINDKIHDKRERNVTIRSEI